MIYKKIKALYFWIFFVLSVALVIFCFCFTKSQNTLWKIRKIWAKFQRYTISYKQEIIGTFNPQAQMILMNHQSALDISINICVSIYISIWWVEKGGGRGVEISPITPKLKVFS